MTDIESLATILSDVSLFSKGVIRLPLHDYQLEPCRAVLHSILHKLGLEFLWVFPRQSGKDEAIAQLSVFLLLLHYQHDLGIVHVYPSKPQLPIGIERLETRLNNPWTSAKWWHKNEPPRRGLGDAKVTFFSGHPSAKSEGATASLLLIINEMQDHIGTLIDRRFTPMRASTNATALHVGTVRTRTDALWRKKAELEKQQARDGLKRVFITDPETVGHANPHYMTFVNEQIRLKGRHHPIICTEYFNEPIDAAAKLFPPRRLALMRGEHSRRRTPEKRKNYIALIDIGGQDEAAVEAFKELQSPGRDYTLCTILQVTKGLSDLGAVFDVMDVFVDHGSRHFQQVPGQPSLFHRLLAYLNHWHVIAVVSDMTGVGQGLTDALIEAYPMPVFGFDFCKAHGKARLGSDFLAVVETARFRYFADGLDRPGSDSWWFFEQAAACGYELPEGQPIEKGLRWGVGSSVRTQLPDGTSTPTHDDRLLSAALVAEADRLIRAGSIVLSIGASAIIEPPPLDIEGDEW